MRNFEYDHANQTLYQSAPREAKFLLVAKFPGEFAKFALEDLKKGDLVPQSVCPIIEAASLLRANSRDRVLGSVASYAIAKQEAERSSGIVPSETIVKEALGATANLLMPEEAQKKESPKIEDIEKDARLLVSVIEEAHSPDPKIAQAASELVTALGESYFQPLVKSVFFKPAAIFWSLYHEQHPDAMTVPPRIMKGFLEIYAGEKIAASDQDPEAKEAVKYVREQILPQVLQEFIADAEFAPNIAYFNKTGAQGNKRHLFLHQVEAVRKSVSGEILADEPGTGKTLELALSALNLMDNQGIKGGKVLVVGSKSVIDNWEGEIEKHLETDRIEVVNASFTRERERSGVDYTLQQRLRKLEKGLENASDKHQFVLVYYDLFRSPGFQKILEKHQCSVVIVDEAHNIKSRFLKSIQDQSSWDETVEAAKKARIAQRTRGLYGYLKSTDAKTVFLATSTPFVKELVEPLIMAHLANPLLVPADKVQELMHDAVGTNQALQMVMLRRRKEEIADLPARETTFIPIDLNSLSEQEKEAFISTAKIVSESAEGSFGRFYSFLALENQAKFPWLADKVKEITTAGRKVVIFTPFVTEEGRNTSAISTAFIAGKLRKMGISSVGVLDGSMDEMERLAVQRDFLRPDGIKALVGNYLTAGESLTLCSPQNRATDVILFTGPNAVSRYIQAIDRIHRYGQTEKVTIHIPYVTGDLLKRAKGTYDERVIRRLVQELSVFSAVIDGLFFVEGRDIYQAIALADPIINGTGRVIFDSAQVVKTDMAGGRQERGRNRFQSHSIVGTEELSTYLTSDDGEEIDFGWTTNIQEVLVRENSSDLDSLQLYLEQIHQYPLLNFEQEQILFRFIREDVSMADLRQNAEFLATIPPETDEKFQRVLADSKTIKEFVANCNLGLVVSVARKYQGSLPLLDLIQEGNIGLMRTIELFDYTRGFKFSTYANWWIRQAITRGIDETSLTVDLPVHVRESFRKAKRVADEFIVTNGRHPKKQELRKILLDKTDFTDGQINAVFEVVRLGIMQLASLDRRLKDESDSDTLGDFVHDGNNIEDLAAQSMDDEVMRAEISRAVMEQLSDREAQVIAGRFGAERSLEEIGQVIGVTRERVRQIEAAALDKLRADGRLKKWYETDTPSVVYRTSVEEAAFKLGLFEDPFDRARRRITKEEKIEVTEVRTENFQQDQTVILHAAQINEIWNQIPDFKKSILNLYYRNDSDKDLLKQRLVAIFGFSSTSEVEETIASTLKDIEEVLRKRYTYVNQGFAQTEWDKELELDTLISELVKKDLSYRQISELLSIRESRVKRIRPFTTGRN